MDVVLLGSGNLATNLAVALHNSGVRIIQVYSKTENNARILAEKIDSNYTCETSKLKDADIYISALKDSISQEIWNKIDFKNKLVLHTSGSLSIDELKKHSSNRGVIYPLMTLSKDRIINFLNVPFLIEGNTPENTEVIENLAKRISNNVRTANSNQRANIHLAAVWANNFSNHMYAIAQKITDENDFPFSILNPLIDETAQKVHDLKPIDAQTGPAKRYDKNIIDKQTEACPKEYQELYRSISESIHQLEMSK